MPNHVAISAPRIIALKRLCNEIPQAPFHIRCKSLADALPQLTSFKGLIVVRNGS